MEQKPIIVDEFGNQIVFRPHESGWSDRDGDESLFLYGGLWTDGEWTQMAHVHVGRWCPIDIFCCSTEWNVLVCR